MAVFFHSIKRYEDALNYYKQAQKFVGEQFGLFYNMALCEHQLEIFTDSLENFKNALRLENESKEAKEWIGFLEKILADKNSHPES